MYVVTNAGVVMVDTPWDPEQFQPLLDSIEARHHKKVVLCIATHFHDDRTAGLEFLNGKGIPTYSSRKTYDFSGARREKQAAFTFQKDTVFRVGNKTFQTFFPGAGHSPENIVIWFEQEKVLYGGCFIKNVENSSLGNLEDADVVRWQKSVRKLMKRFPAPSFVVPGHFGWADNKAVGHTAALLQLANTKKSASRRR